MGTRPQILIADDHVVFAESLRLLLEKHYTVVGTVADGRALIAEARRLKPDLILVDVGMPLLKRIGCCQAGTRATSKSETRIPDHAGRP